MRDNRLVGLLLVVIGCLVMAGVTYQTLPGIAFWAGVIVFPIGGYLMLLGNREAEEARTLAREALKHERARIPNPTLEAFERQHEAVNDSPSVLDFERQARVATTAATGQVQADELVLYEVDGDASQGDDGDEGFSVTSDVSFPIEVQEQDGLAGQLEKLTRLKADGILSDEEFAVAKAKLLS